MIYFGDSAEPWSVSRGGIKRWLHCRIGDIGALSEERQAELAEWLESRSLPAGSRLLVTRDQVGSHTLHIAGAAVELALADLPLWLQGPAPQLQPAPKPPARRAKAPS